ncbi:hypothetical protein BD770DRAFT_477136 [Pilaira anomala]|nr:hypothetical protein BD770DRAFT_477136 [Pilaira anomala]
MSITREGWKSQKILAQVCRQCLSKVVTTPVKQQTRQFGTQKVLFESEKATTPGPSLMETFRHELYQPTPIALRPNIPYSAWVKKTIVRRQGRKRILNMYQLMKNRHPNLLSQLSQRDLNSLVRIFITNPDDPSSNGPMQEAFQILQDLKKGTLFSQASFGQPEMELLIYLATELKYTRKALDLLSEATQLYQGQLSLTTFEHVFGLLSREKKSPKTIDVWLSRLANLGYQPSKSIVRSVVISKISNELDDAASYLRKHHPTTDLARLVNTHTEDARDLLDNALNVFAIDCLEEWRLNDARNIYLRKREVGMSTNVIVKRVMDKALHTGQVQAAERMLKDTIKLEDTFNVKLCSRKLIDWYLSYKDIKQAVLVWDQLEQHGLELNQEVMEELMIEAAKLKYHVDAMRLYRRCNDLYPTTTSIETAIYVFRSLVNTKDFVNAREIQGSIESALHQRKLTDQSARIATRALFGLSAQTGDVALFERIFETSEKLKLGLTHRGLTSLVAMYLRRGEVHLAKAAFQQVAARTNGPDVVDFNLLMRTIVMEEQRVDYDKIFEILTHMKLVDVQPDETTLRTMLMFYRSESEMQRSLYEKLLVNPTSISRFNQVYLNNLAFKNLLTEKTIAQVVGILKRGNRGELFPSEANTPILVNGATYSILLTAANENRDYTSIAELLIKDMLARGWKPKRLVYEELIRNLAKKGKIAKARKYIALMEKETGEKAGAETYTKLIDGFLYLKKPHLAKHVVLDDLIKNKIRFDEVVREKVKTVNTKLYYKKRRRIELREKRKIELQKKAELKLQKKAEELQKKAELKAEELKKK